MLRGTLLYLSERPTLKRVLGGRLARPLVRRFVAGETLTEAIENIQKLNAANMTASLKKSPRDFSRFSSMRFS